MLEVTLAKLGSALQDANTRKQFVRRVWRIIHVLFLVITICYAGCLMLLPVMAAWIGEKNISLAFWLYVPRVIALLPLPVLFFFTLFVSRKLALLQLIAGLIFLTFGMGYEWRANTKAQFGLKHNPAVLTALTYNRGQHANKSLQPFKNLVKPDIIALQESPGRAKRYLADKNYSEFNHASSIGEHTFLSRYPILSEELVELGEDIGDNTPAARFVISFNGQQVAVYSVHFITVRDTLLHYRRGAFLYGILGLVPGTPFEDRINENNHFWMERIRSANALIKRIENETIPTLVVGDFNAPSGGFIHRCLTRELQDSHEVAGSGFGYSFPGTTRNPLSLGGPWMRIDYICASHHWDITASITEADRPSQHRAVASKLSLK